MRVLVLALAGLAASSGGAFADRYSCHSIAGEPAATVAFDLDYSSGAYAVASAAFQIEGDIGYSTTADDPLDLATITGVGVGGGRVRFSFHYRDAEYDGDVATVDVVTLSEGAHILTAGVLHVVAGGLWPVQCDIDHEG